MKNRVIWKMFVLEIITLGFYRLYWLIKTQREMMKSDSEIKILNPLVLIAPIVVTILAVTAFILSTINSAANVPAYCSELSSSSYTPDECVVQSSGVVMVLFFAAVFLVAPLVIIWLWGYAKGVEKITKGNMSFPVALLILYVVPDGIDILLVQDSFNKVSSVTPEPVNVA